ncbi:MAG TPA: YebC/PmpR family DNA-binding transcriptional regulator [Phycisphaerales bacterium]|nr:YebC/PmpR family DNA-binding transcriptional regulator [Phycisphaerales bacterium]
MAKHNKWSKIKHRKAVVDKRRGKVWTKISKAITVAAKTAGPDPASNLTLRYAIDEARYANMPRDTIERAIQKGAGGGDTSSYESVRYEGYAPGGVAVVVDALTDNRTRTVALVREVFEEFGGNMGASGCVGFMFQTRGRIVVSGPGLSDDRVIEAGLEAGALDVRSPSPLPAEDEEGEWEILTDVPSFIAVRDRVEKSGLPVTDAGIVLVPDSATTVRGEQAQAVSDLIDSMEDLDDVQKVYTNADFEE